MFVVVLKKIEYLICVIWKFGFCLIFWLIIVKEIKLDFSKIMFVDYRMCLCCCYSSSKLGVYLERIFDLCMVYMVLE